MARRTAPVERVVRYFVDHALIIELKRRHVVNPMNVFDWNTVVVWEYRVIFGATNRSLFSGRDLVTSNINPEEAAGELIRALDVSNLAYGEDVNDAQYAFMKDVQPRYAAMFKGGSILNVPGAEFQVNIPRQGDAPAVIGERLPLGAQRHHGLTPEEDMVLQALTDLTKDKPRLTSEPLDVV